MENRDLSISMHTYTHTSTPESPNTSKHCHSYSINCERTRNKSHECNIYDWIPFESNWIESNWITLIIIILCTNALTHSLSEFQQIIDPIEIRSTVERMCRTQEEKKNDDHFVSLFFDGWLHLYNFSAFVATAAAARTQWFRAEEIRTCVYFRQIFVQLFSSWK